MASAVRRFRALRAGAPSAAVALFLFGMAGVPAPAAAAPKAAKTAAKPPKGAKGKADKAAVKTMPPEALEKLREDLHAERDGTAVDAAKQLGASGAADASGVLIELLAVGARPGVAIAALDALAKLKDPKALEVIELYAGNRNPEVRSRAVNALGKIPDARAVETLLARLGDTAPEVRAAAAEQLAERKEAKAEPRLFELVRRNDGGASGPLGVLATPDTIARLADLQGRVEDGVLAGALGEFVKRDGIADTLRLEVVTALGKIPGAGATTALIEYIGSVPEKEERPSKNEAQKLVDQRSAEK